MQEVIIDTLTADNIAEKLCHKDDRDFWKKIKDSSCSKWAVVTVHCTNDERLSKRALKL